MKKVGGGPSSRSTMASTPSSRIAGPLLLVASAGGPEKVKKVDGGPSTQSTMAPTHSSRIAGPLPHLSASPPAPSS